MTPTDALETFLAVPLRFGDAKQIEAVRLLHMAEVLLELPRVCPDCDGKGETDEEVGYCSHCGRECVHCDGGSEICHECKGTGRIEWTRDAVYRLSAERITVLIAEGRKEAA
jgi:predicted amidophosphoribosyltransferase